MEKGHAVQAESTTTHRQESASQSSEDTQQGVFLVLGGTGMLLPAVKKLLEEGKVVIVVARHASQAKGGVSKTIEAVDADWSRPEEYGQACRQAVAGREVIGVILWVHQPYRDAITQAIEYLLGSHTRVVRLWGSSGGNPRATSHAAYQPRRGDLCEVYLGRQVSGEGEGWLSHEQISQGALAGLRGTAREYSVGQLAAWPPSTSSEI